MIGRWNETLDELSDSTLEDFYLRPLSDEVSRADGEAYQRRLLSRLLGKLQSVLSELVNYPDDQLPHAVVAQVSSDLSALVSVGEWAVGYGHSSVTRRARRQARHNKLILEGK